MRAAAAAPLLASLLALVGGVSVQRPLPWWWNKDEAPEVRARYLLDAMTHEEKVTMLSGCAGCPYVGVVQGNKRLGIPPLQMQDGPQGFRATQYPATTIAWPSGLTVAATWDPEAMYSWGEAMGKEFRGKGSNVQLGPGMNIARVPENGRNFEYMAGEDPKLGYVLGKSVVKGIQSQGVIATAKHFVLNSEELERGFASEDADERTRFEIYYPPFQGAVDAGVGALMCSYNKIFGKYACENSEILQTDLRERMGFKGFVMSDWGATHSPSLKEGLDMEMPTVGIMSAASLKEHHVSEEAVNSSVHNILTAMFAVGLMDDRVDTWSPDKLPLPTVTNASLDLAKRLSAESTVLLKNEGGLLPLPQNKKIVVIGFGGDNAITHGAGSGDVSGTRVVTPFEGIRDAAGPHARVTYTDTDLGNAHKVLPDADYAVIFVGASATEMVDRHTLDLDGGCVEYLAVNMGMTAVKQGGDPKPACLGTNPLFGMSQKAAILEVAKAKPGRTIVVASVPGAVLMPWSHEVPAILTNFLPGQEVGRAIADVLFGNINPSGKLPVTFPNRDSEASTSLGMNLGDMMATRFQYREKLLVGYRQYDAHRIGFTTGFPFGHGLSYTTFEYSNVAHGSEEGGFPRTVTFDLRNSGLVPGREVAQLYLKFPDSAQEPPQQLKYFHKSKLLKPDEVERVVMRLSQKDFSIWSELQHGWELVKGDYVFRVGSSSRDIRLRGNMTL